MNPGTQAHGNVVLGCNQYGSYSMLIYWMSCVHTTLPATRDPRRSPLHHADWWGGQTNALLKEVQEDSRWQNQDPNRRRLANGLDSRQQKAELSSLVPPANVPQEFGARPTHEGRSAVQLSSWGLHNGLGGVGDATAWRQKDLVGKCPCGHWRTCPCCHWQAVSTPMWPW